MVRTVGFASFRRFVLLGLFLFLAVWVGTAEAQLYTLSRTFLSPTPTTNDNFGYAVAAVGNDVLVGAPFDNTAGSDAGAAYLFDGSTGVLLQTFLNPTPSAIDQFGNSVAALGANVLIGAPGDDDSGANNAGAAYLFNSSSGTLMRTFTKTSPAANDNFGYVVAALGGNVVVGAPFDNTGATDAGAAYLFDANSGATLQTYLNPNPANGDEFGFSLAILGSDVLVGAPLDNVGANDAGAVYLMNGATGALIRTFSDPLPIAGDNFGYSVASVGSNILVGAPYADTGATDAGAVYLISGSSGALLQPIVNPSPVTLDQFGNSVAATGSSLVAGAPGDDMTATDAGSAYLFEPCGLTPEPPGTCTQPALPGRALFLMKNVDNNNRDVVTWKWLKGPVTPKSAFGDPLNTSSYALCAYNDPGGMGSPQLIFRATALAGGLCRGRPCWKESLKGFRYVNRDTTPDGVLRLKLTEGTTPEKAKIIFKAKGNLLQFPSMPLTVPTEVTVQLKNSDGQCWEAVYSDPPVRNRTNLFKDRSD